MPTLFTHAFVGAAGAGSCPTERRSARFWALIVTSSLLPDADAVGLALGIPYGALLGHRGVSHSLTFALLWSLCVVGLAFRTVPSSSWHWGRLALVFFGVTASHGVLDALTNGGLGIAFFAPFDNTRYFLPWHPIQVSPIGLGTFLDPQGLAALLSEAKFVWVPLSLLCLAVCAGRRFLTTDTPVSPEGNKPAY